MSHLSLMRHSCQGLYSRPPEFILLRALTWSNWISRPLAFRTRTKDGVADFHAAGRHTYITELLRNGTSLVEARELARHADVKMTMNYTHIGLEDRAKAVQNLPTDPKWLQMRCISGVPEGHLQSSDDTGCHSDAAGSGDTSPCEMSPSGTQRQKKAPPVTDGAQWRRRESNPRPATFPWKLLRV